MVEVRRYRYSASGDRFRRKVIIQNEDHCGSAEHAGTVDLFVVCAGRGDVLESFSALASSTAHCPGTIRAGLVNLWAQCAQILLIHPGNGRDQCPFTRWAPAAGVLVSSEELILNSVLRLRSPISGQGAGRSGGCSLAHFAARYGS